MSRFNKTITFAFLICALSPLTTFAQIGGNGWKSFHVSFNVQSPTNVPQNQRYFVTNAPQPTYHCLVYSNDGAFSVGNTTKPRTEQRFTPDYTNGEIQYQAMEMCPSNENSYCCFQVHTGDAQSPAFGSTTFMIFWFTNNNGSVHDYSGTTLATNLGNKWFQLNYDHNVVTGQIRVWVNGKQVWAQQDNGAGDFYLKDGVYEQDHNPTLQMDTYITNILMWTNTGVNPPPAPTNLVATPTATKIPLTWFTAWDPTNFTFNVKRSTTSGGSYTIITNLTGTSYTDTNVVVGTTYYYVVSAINQFGESSNSVQVAASLFNLGFQLSASPSSIAMNAGISTNYTVAMTTNSSYTGTTTLGVSGGLPSGATANFSPPSLSIAGNSTLTVNTVTNTPSGSYTLTISGTNGANVFSTTATLTLTGISANPGTLVWTGSGVDTNWSTILDWTNTTVGGFGPPGTNNSLIFTNTGAVANSSLTSPGSGVVISANVNSFVDGNYSVIGLTNFASAVNTSPVYHNLQIVSGATFTAGGIQIGGFTFFALGDNNVTRENIVGAGGTLMVTNGGVTVSSNAANGPNNNALLDLSGLDNFTMNGTQIRLAVEGGGSFHHASGVMYLARTNSVTLSTSGYVDSGAGSPDNGNPALTLGHNKSALGTGAQLYLGIANTLELDYATIGRGDANDLLAFNPAFLSQSPTVIIRGTNGANSRVGVYVVGDDSAGQGGSTFNTNDFSGGTVSALINYLCVGRGRDSANETTMCKGFLTFDNGSINANTLAIGFLYPSGSNSVAGGTVNVNGGTLTIVTNIAIASRPNVGGSGSASGTLNINGGTIFATNISGGGGTATVNLNSGILNLQGSGQITNVTTLLIGDGMSDSALLSGAATISSPNAITIAANGTLSGNTIIATPDLIVNGLLSPGIDGVGAMTNNGANGGTAQAAFGAGGSFSVAVQNANGSPASGWDFLQINGALTISANSGNPFTIQLESFDPNGSGLVTNFNSSRNYDWTIASASGGIANFSADRFTVDASQFANNLNDGYFYVRTNNNSLVLSFTNPLPVPMPVQISQSGTNFIFSGSNGTADAQYYVLASTNVALSPSQWTVIATNTFDGNGNFNFTNPADPTAPQMFYLLQLR